MLKTDIILKYTLVLNVQTIGLLNLFLTAFHKLS